MEVDLTTEETAVVVGSDELLAQKHVDAWVSECSQEVAKTNLKRLQSEHGNITVAVPCLAVVSMLFTVSHISSTPMT